MAGRGDQGEAGRPSGIVGGFVHPGRPDLIYLNVAAPEHLLRLTGHELAHSLRKEDPALWKELTDGLRPLIRNWAEYRATLSDKRYASLTEDEQFEELVGDVVGHNFMNELFWQEMAEAAPTVFRRIARKAVALLSRALQLLSTRKGVERYVSDLTQTRAVVAKALLRYGEKARKGMYEKYAQERDAGYLGQRIDGAAILRELRAAGISDELIMKAVGGTRAETDGEDFKFSIVQSVRDRTEATKVFAGKLTAKRMKMVFESFSDWLPPELKTGFASVLSNPHYDSKKSKPRTDVYDLSLKRSDNANEMKVDIMSTDGDYEGLEGFRDHHGRAKKDEKGDIDKILVVGDEKSVEYTEEQLDGTDNPLGRTVAEVVKKAYFAARQTIAKATEVLFDRLGRLRLLPHEGQEYYQELIDLLDEGLSADEVKRRLGINQEAIAAYLGIQSSRKRLDVLIKPYNTQAWSTLLRQLIERGVSAAQVENDYYKSWDLVEAFREVRKQLGDKKITTAEKHLKAQWYKTLVELLEKREDHPMMQKLELFNAYKGVQEYDSRLAELKADWGKLKGYLPRLRKDGRWHVKVYEVDTETGELAEVFMRPAKTKGGANWLKADIDDALGKNRLREFIPRRYREGAAYEVRVEKNRATPEEIFMGLGSHRSIEALFSKIVEELNAAGRIDNPLGLQNQMLEILHEEISVRGFGKHKMHRSKDLIEGYETENTPAIISQFVGGMAGYLSKAEFAMRANKVMGEIPADQGEDKIWVKHYVDDALKNATYVDQVLGTLRSFAALMFLGFKISSAALNGTQNYIWGQAVLSKHTKGATRKLLKAQHDVVKDHLLIKAGKESILTEEERWALEEGSRKGRTSANYVRSMSGLDDTGGVMGKGQSAVRWLTEKSMMPFQMVETYWNREPALLAMFRVARAEGLSKEAALEKAMKFSDDVHFVIGKENIPALLRKLGPIGRTLYTFQSYPHNYLLGMFTSLQNKEFAVVARSLTALVLFGGLAAVPFGDDLDKWYRRIFGERPLRMLEKWLRETAGNYTDFGDQIADFVLHGAPALGGVNFSRALAVNVPWFSAEDESMAERVTGVWGGMAQKVVYGMDAAGKGDFWRAAEYVSPQFIANALRGVRNATDGATTMSGGPVFGGDGKQERYTAGEGVIRAFGFMPLRPSKESEARWDTVRARQHWTNRKADVLARWRIADTQEERQEAMEAIREFKRDLREAPGGVLVPDLNGGTLIRALRWKPDRRELLYRQQLRRQE
jgi:hypothetical protein